MGHAGPADIVDELGELVERIDGSRVGRIRADDHQVLPAEARAHELGLAAIAITDRNTLAGVVRAHLAARELGIRLVVGTRLDFTDAPSLLCLPTDRAAYGRLSRLITLGRRRAPKGECHIGLADFFDHADGQIAILLPPGTDLPDADFAVALRRSAAVLAGRWIGFL